MQEIRRVLFGRYQALLLAALFAFEVLLWYQQQRPDYEFTMAHVDTSVYECAQYEAEYTAKLASCPVDELAARIELYAETDAEDSYDESVSRWLVGRGLLHLRDRAAKLAAYPERLANIERQAEQMATISAFTKDEFTLLNIQKTVRDFKPLQNIELTFGNDPALASVLKFEGTGYLLAVWLVFLCLRLCDERGNGAWQVVHTTKNGRGALAAVRVGAVLLGALVGVAVLAGGLLAVSCFVYGTPGWSRTAQSIAELQNYPRLRTVGGVTLLWGLYAWLGAAAVGLAVWLVFSVFRNVLQGMLGALALLAAEAAAFYSIPAQSTLAVLKAVNLLAFLKPGEYFLQYRNLRTPFGLVWQNALLAVLWPVLIAALGAAAVAVNAKRSPAASSRAPQFIETLSARLSQKFGAAARVLREPYKLFIDNRGWLAVVIIAAAIYVDYNSSHIVYFDKETTYMLSYVSRWQGLEPEQATQRITLEYNQIDAQQQKLETQQAANITPESVADGTFSSNSSDLNAAYYSQNISKCVMLKSVLLDLQQHVDSLAETHSQTGINVVLTDEYGMGLLLGSAGESMRMRDTLLLLFAAVLLGAPMLSAEWQSGAALYIRSCARGRTRFFASKYALLAALCAALGASLCAAEIEVTWRMYGGWPLDIPVQSISSLASFGLPLSVGQFLVLYVFVRVLALLAAAAAVLLVSVLVRHTVYALFAALAVCLLPAVGASLGSGALGAVSLYWPVEGAALLLGGKGAVYLVCAAVLAACLWLACDIWNGGFANGAASKRAE